MDEEFGVNELIQETFHSNKEDRSYSSQHLSGLTIQHKQDHFRDGKTVVLTLKDSKILDEEEDVLVNVNMMDDEKGSRNIELKKNLPGYQPYEEQFDEYGNVSYVLVM